MKLRSKKRNLCYVLLVWFAFAPDNSQAQAKPSPTPESAPGFVGQWKYQKAETPAPALVDAGKRQEEIEISQAGAEIRFRYTVTEDKHRQVFEKVYYTDGRGETNMVRSDKNLEFFSTTKLKERKLFIEWCTRKIGSTETKPLARDEWILSNDGKSLRMKRVTLAKVPDNFVGVTYVYKRQ